MTPAETLRRAKARIEDPEHWCAGSYAQNATGDPLQRGSSDAVRWCAIGALEVKAAISACFPYLMRAARRLNGLYVAQTNDTLGHAAVMKMYDLAIEIAEAEEAEE